MPFDVNVNTLDTALELVQGAAQPNGGLAIDTWHMGKLGISPEDLQRIPPEYLGWVELSDGQFENMPDPIDEIVNHRRLPGEGEFDIPGYVEACREVGYAGPWGVEVLSEELRNLPIEEEFKRAYETTAAQFRAGVDLRRTRRRKHRCSSWTTTGWSGCSPRCCGSASSRSASSGHSRSIPA